MLLTINEYDIANDIAKPVTTFQSTRVEKVNHEMWLRANKVALSILESDTDKVRIGIKRHELATDYLKEIEQNFRESHKDKISQYMSLLTTYVVDNAGSI